MTEAARPDQGIRAASAPSNGLECAACGEPLSPKAGAERCGCRFCGAIHVVDRSASPPSVRLSAPSELAAATGRAQGELKTVLADLRFLEVDTVAQRKHLVFAIVCLALLCLAGASLLVYASRMEDQAKDDPEASKGTIFMPTMSKTTQTIVTLRVIGAAFLLVALATVFLLPWRRWGEAKRVLRIARGNRVVLEDLIRRLTETARRPSA